jgi:hypothetical protein
MEVTRSEDSFKNKNSRTEISVRSILYLMALVVKGWDRIILQPYVLPLLLLLIIFVDELGTDCLGWL